MHTFELSGLGKAPFKIVKQEQGNQAFYCEHCGTMLKHRYFIKSSDGKVSVVGIDCLRKTGDLGLYDGAKLIKKEKQAQAREIKNQVKREARLAQERKRYGGKTHGELTIELINSIEREKTGLARAIQEMDSYKTLCKTNFGVNVLRQLSEARDVSTNVYRILTEILAKDNSQSRKNSNAYKAALPGAEKAVEDLKKTVSKGKAAIKDLQQQLSKHQTDNH